LSGVIPGKLQAETEEMPVLHAVARDFTFTILFIMCVLVNNYLTDGLLFSRVLLIHFDKCSATVGICFVYFYKCSATVRDCLFMVRHLPYRLPP